MASNGVKWLTRLAGRGLTRGGGGNGGLRNGSAQ